MTAPGTAPRPTGALPRVARRAGAVGPTVRRLTARGRSLGPAVQRLADRPLPVPPDLLRQGPLRRSWYASPLHSERTAAFLGLWLGITFTTCFGTGLISHVIQHPAGWELWPTRPVNLYRVTQGLHVVTGLAAIPLLLAKLWVVAPKLWQWPPARTVGHAVERLALLLLVGGAVFQLFTGLANIAYWYPFGFSFPTTHFWTAWITIGALIVHIGSKAALARRGLSATSPDLATPAGPGLSRRGFLATIGLASGVVVVTTAGSTVPGLRAVDLLGTRRPDIGPQGLPVNQSAVAAGVTGRARDPAYRLRVTGAVPRPMSLSLADLQALPQRTASLPISCVEGWSAGAVWSGVPLRDLLAAAGADPAAHVRIESLQAGGVYRSSVLPPAFARDGLTLLALRLHGEELHVDHGYPVRLIAPDRPGVLQTKWVASVVVL